jgi:hypothetical protein
MWTGWWLKNHLEKSWSSSIGFGLHPIYKMVFFKIHVSNHQWKISPFFHHQADHLPQPSAYRVWHQHSQRPLLH